MGTERTQKMSLLRGSIEEIPGLLDLPTTEPVAINKLWWNAGVLSKSIGIPPSITSQPSNTTIEENSTAVLSLTATNATSYQWQRSVASVWTNVGTSASSYTTPTLSIVDTGSQYRCIVTGPGGSVTSSTATVTVTPPVVSPTQIFAGGYQGDHWDAFTLGNLFQLSGGTTPVTADGQPVGYVRGQINNNHLIQATAGQRPIYKTGGYLQFTTASSHNLAAASSAGLFKFLHDGTGGTLLIACRLGTTADPNTVYGIASSSAASAANVGFTLTYDDRASSSRSDGLTIGVYNASSTIINIITNDSLPANTDGVISATFGISQTPDFNLAVGGDSVATANVASAASSANSTNNFAIGGLGGGGSSPMTGRVYAVLAINRILSAAEIEGWALWVNQRMP
jgi:hypothetical protein